MPAVADAMVSSGLAKAGYSYLNLDDGIVASKGTPPPSSAYKMGGAHSGGEGGRGKGGLARGNEVIPAAGGTRIC